MIIDPDKLILWRDEALLVINKPAGLATLPDGYDPAAPHVKSVFEPEYGRLWIVHRLDRETSGALLIARSVDAHRILNDQFEKRTVRKIYWAIVQGNPDWSEKNVRTPLLADGDRRHRTIIEPQSGKPASTELRVLERFNAYALLEAIPLTGRTHQIRAHCSSLGLPLVGDGLYGGPPSLFLSMLKAGFQGGARGECALLQRTALHSHLISLIHPVTSQAFTLEAPLPKDFRAALRQLRRYGG
jgi:RluA family pseudouridine synthase